MIEPLPSLPDNVLGFKATGEVSSKDYESTLIPAVEGMAKEWGRVRLLYELGPDFSGYTAGAIWDDAKLGLRNWGAWEKVAVVTDHEWVRHVVGAFAPILPCPVVVFASGELAAATKWISI